LGKKVRGPGRIYLTGGATAVLHGWRPMTIDIDLKPEPEPAGLFEAIASLKNELDINVELASPDQFIPALPGWQEAQFVHRRPRVDRVFSLRSLWPGLGQTSTRTRTRFGRTPAQCCRTGLIQMKRLRELFQLIEPQLIRYPAIDPAAFRAAVATFSDENR
jgi:hypothetical protein